MVKRPSRLSPLQRGVLVTLAPLVPRWTLTGGAALAGVHLGHRTTRDLDLFWHGRSALEQMPLEAERLLLAGGYGVNTTARSIHMHQLIVSYADERVVLDLVADRVPTIVDPITVDLDGTQVQVDAPQEILINKLCAMLGRNELRDLVDVDALIASGCSLSEAVRNAPKKDSGFSPLTLAWVLQQLPLDRLARAEGMSEADLTSLIAFREHLIDELTTVPV